MREKEILSDFQFLGNRVSNLSFDTKIIDTKGQQAQITFEFDYDVIQIEEHEDNYFGIIEFIVKAKAMFAKKSIFKIHLEMEGAFACGKRSMPKEKFEEMLEVNGLITLSQISRAYLLSVTSQSGINPPVKMPMINVMKLRELKLGNNKKT